MVAISPAKDVNDYEEVAISAEEEYNNSNDRDTSNEEETDEEITLAKTNNQVF